MRPVNPQDMARLPLVRIARYSSKWIAGHSYCYAISHVNTTFSQLVRARVWHRAKSPRIAPKTAGLASERTVVHIADRAAENVASRKRVSR